VTPEEFDVIVEFVLKTQLWMTLTLGLMLCQLLTCSHHAFS